MMYVLGLIKRFSRDLFALMLLSFFVYLLIRPMRANEGMWIVFDDVHIARSEALLEELHAGQFPVRLLQSFGNTGGYPLFNYYSPLTYYLSAVLIEIGINPLNSVKLLFQLAYVICAVGMYVYLRVGLGLSKKAGIVGAIAAISSAYFNYDAYTRGALAELLGFASLPWFLTFFEVTLRQKKWYYVILAATCLSVVFIFHAITGIIAVLMCVCIVATRTVLDKKQAVEHLRLTISLLGLSGLLSAWYLLPVLLEKQYVRYSAVEFVQTGYKDAAISVKEIFGFTSINPEIIPITLGLGISILLGISVTLVLHCYLKNKSSLITFLKTHQLAFSYSVAIFITLFLLTPLSWALWEHVSILQILQFPYRFLAFLTCISVAYILVASKQCANKIVRGLLLLALLVASYQTNYFAEPKGYYFSDRFAAEDTCTTTTWQQEYLPVDTKICIPKDGYELVTGSDGVQILSVAKAISSGDIVVKTNGRAGTLTFAKYYFPGWKVTSGIMELEVYPTTEHGLLTASVPENTTHIVATYGKTRIQAFSEWLSVTTFVVVALYATRKMLQDPKTSKKLQ